MLGTLTRLYAARGLRPRTVRGFKKIQEIEDGNTIRVSVVDVEETPKKRVFNRKSQGCALCTCDLPIRISYADVLILEQFMRADGTVLPKELTGLCIKQQFNIERCVMQAHWSGLFPDRTNTELDLAGYKRFKRYWNDDSDMVKLKLREEPGSWYYVKRYNSKKNEFSNPVPTQK